MKRTNVYFPIPMHQSLLRLAKRQDTSLARLVRDFVDKGLKQEKKSWADSFKRMVSSAKKSNIGDLASSHDKYLYD